jgi:hypothetical protein
MKGTGKYISFNSDFIPQIIGDFQSQTITAQDAIILNREKIYGIF